MRITEKPMKESMDGDGDDPIASSFDESKKSSTSSVSCLIPEKLP
jgi:hypothetical protein